MHTKFKYVWFRNIFKELLFVYVKVFKKGDGFKGTGGGSDVHTGTEAWNIAQYFTGFSIALPLKDLNDLEDIARFGTVAMDEDLIMTDDVIDRRRAEAVRRYWQKLKQIITDTLFKIKAKDRDEADRIKDWLDKLPQYFDGLLSIKKNNVTNDDAIQVNEEFLTEILNKLVSRKQEYLVILDHTGLIFKESSEINLDELMKEYSSRG